MDFEMGPDDDIMGALASLDPVAQASGSAAGNSFLSAAIAKQDEGTDAKEEGNGAPAEAIGAPPPLIASRTGSVVEQTKKQEPASASAGGGAAAAASSAEPKEEEKYPHMKRSGVTPNLQNFVAMFSCGLQLDLKHIALHAANAEYNPKRFAAVIMRIREPKTTALMFQSGKVVVTGASSEEASKEASKKFAKILKKLGFKARFIDYRIQNIVGSTGVNFPIQLEKMAADHSMFCSYEPELFPGLIFRMAKPKVVLLIFVSGKIVFTGARSRDQVYKSFDNIYPVLCRYNKAGKTAPGPSKKQKTAAE